MYVWTVTEAEEGGSFPRRAAASTVRNISNYPIDVSVLSVQSQACLFLGFSSSKLSENIPLRQPGASSVPLPRRMQLFANDHLDPEH